MLAKARSNAAPIALLLLLAATCGKAPAQLAATPPPVAFEVATIKPIEPGTPYTMDLRVYPGGRLVARGQNVIALIAMAFDTPAWQISGVEKWTEQLNFNIEGKPPAELHEAAPTGEYSNFSIGDPTVRAMLQALLVERFHLHFHLTTQPGTVYLLERSSGPLRLRPIELSLYTTAEDGTVKPSRAYPTGDIGLVQGVPVSISQTSMTQLARWLGNFQHATVLDRTGLPGFYNFRSQTIVTKEDFQNGGPIHLLIEAVPEMGLKLQKTEGPVQRFVIDHLDQPTAN